jgi:hypothetical protein
MHVVGDDKLGRVALGNFTRRQEIRDDADHLAAMVDNGGGD